MVDRDFIDSHTATVPLEDGGKVVVRPIVPEDREALIAGFERLSEASRRFRFFRGKDRLTEEELRYLTEIDYSDHFAWVALDPDEGPQSGVGVARYVRSKDDPEVAEPAVTVVDDHQGRGIGGILLRLLAESAVQNGIRRFRAEVLGDNVDALSGVRGLGRVAAVESGVISVDVDLPLDASPFRDSGTYELLRRVAAGEVVARPLSERVMTWLVPKSLRELRDSR